MSPSSRWLCSSSWLTAFTPDPSAAIFRRPEGSLPSLDYLSPYLPILVLLIIAGVLCVAIAILATVLGPRRIFAIKETAFECGSPSTGDPHARRSEEHTSELQSPDHLV